MWAKMSFMLSTMSPGSVGVPTMLCVLPEPVAPYAKMVAFRPLSTPGIMTCNHWVDTWLMLQTVWGYLACCNRQTLSHIFICKPPVGCSSGQFSIVGLWQRGFKAARLHLAALLPVQIPPVVHF